MRTDPVVVDQGHYRLSAITDLTHCEKCFRWGAGMWSSNGGTLAEGMRVDVLASPPQELQLWVR